jgi:hypothetical protein
MGLKLLAGQPRSIPLTKVFEPGRGEDFDDGGTDRPKRLKTCLHTALPHPVGVPVSNQDDIAALYERREALRASFRAWPSDCHIAQRYRSQTVTRALSDNHRLIRYRQYRYGSSSIIRLGMTTMEVASTFNATLRTVGGSYADDGGRVIHVLVRYQAPVFFASTNWAWYTCIADSNEIGTLLNCLVFLSYRYTFIAKSSF